MTSVTGHFHVRPQLGFNKPSFQQAGRVQRLGLLIALRTLWEIRQFARAVALLWLEWRQKWIRSGEPFDYIFPLNYFYSHNTAHWQNCSALLYFGALIFCSLAELARKARLRSTGRNHPNSFPRSNSSSAEWFPSSLCLRNQTFHFPLLIMSITYFICWYYCNITQNLHNYDEIM